MAVARTRDGAGVPAAPGLEQAGKRQLDLPRALLLSPEEPELHKGMAKTLLAVTPLPAQYNCAQGGRGKGCCGDGFGSGTAQTDPWVPKEAGGANNWTKVPHRR
jgi:hypothetical protein